MLSFCGQGYVFNTRKNKSHCFYEMSDDQLFIAKHFTTQKYTLNGNLHYKTSQAYIHDIPYRIFMKNLKKKKNDENIMKLYYWIGRGHFKAFYSIYNTNEVNEISDGFNSTV